MARYTNLALMKKISRGINSDEVDALDETLESLDILEIMERTLDDILSRRHWEFMKDKNNVCTAGANVINVTLPTQMVQLQDARYLEDTTEGRYRTLTYLEPKSFLDRVQGNLKSASNTDTVIFNGVEFYPQNDHMPQFYTSFDELTITVDSYDIAVDASGIVASRMTVLGVQKPTVDFNETTSSAVIQSIPEQMFNYWLWEAIALSSFELRDIENAKAERSARRAYVRLLNLEPVTTRDGQNPVDYGRIAPSRLKRIPKRV